MYHYTPSIDELLQNGSIHPSVNPWASPVIFVEKKDSATNHNIAINFLGLNSGPIKDRYPLPNIQDIFYSFSEKTVYSLIDIKSAYEQITIAEEDRCKTAFTTVGPNGVVV